MNIHEMWEFFIDLTDKVLPTLSSSEQAVYTQLFSNTVAVGRDSCSLSLSRLSVLTGGLSTTTISTALDSLESRGYVRKTKGTQKRDVNSYEVPWPVEVKTLHKFRRDPRVLMKSLNIDEGVYDGVIGRLDKDDRELLDIIIRDLDRDKENYYRKQAKMYAKPGENLKMKFEECVMLAEFGPMRLKKYTQREVKIL
jgi:hypothetical protein